MRKVHIASDGQAFGTTITDVSTGNPIPDVVRFAVEMDANTDRLAHARLDVFGASLDLIVDATITCSRLDEIIASLESVRPGNLAPLLAAIQLAKDLKYTIEHG